VSNPAAAQLCLGDPRVRQWLLDRLVQLINEVQPSYLKWDNNFWVNCNRSGHGHGTHDGNFAHVNGLYQLLEEIRERYPDLLIENVSGGGNRLDFGMVQRSDTGWMDDRTAPSVVVRHNLEGLGDIFSSIFGKGKKEEPKGETVETTVEIPFRTAALGGKVPIALSMNDSCATCSGSGAAPGATVAQCPECKGRGTISFGQGGFAVNRPCPQCRGRGKIPSQKCPTCGGVGETRTEKRVMITVPSGTESGLKIRLKGQGGSGSGGRPAGDLLVTFQVEPDRFFRRDGLDVLCEVSVNVAQAVFGTRLKVKTLDGKKVVLKIPAGTQPGKRFRVKGEGVAKGDRKGDQIVAVQVTIPENPTPEQAALFKKYAEAAGMAF
jgi:molecular chaperone DnaJ